jgi:hypothetical protein
MATLITFGECKNDIQMQNISGVCATSPQFLSYLNTATRKIMRRGDWSGTVVPIQLCAYRGCIVFPRFVGQVRKMNVCKHPTPIRNFWYGFFDHVGWGRSCGGVCGDEISATSGDTSPVFQDIMADGRFVRAYPQQKEDIGKTIVLYGVDCNGQALRTRDPVTKVWSEGITITLALPYGTTTTTVRRIDRVYIPVPTQTNIFLYAYDPMADVLENLATYEPGQMNPNFQKMQLRAPSCCGTIAVGTCGDLKSIVALVKLQYVPVKYDSDIVLISNLDALKLMIMSIREEEAGHREEARAYEADCIRELNLELNDDFPKDQIPVDLGDLGGTGIGIQNCF